MEPFHGIIRKKNESVRPDGQLTSVGGSARFMSYIMGEEIERVGIYLCNEVWAMLKTKIVI